MIPRLQKRRDIQAHNTAHHSSDTEQDRSEVDGETGVRDEGVEDDADALAAGDDGEAVEGDDEEEACGAREAGGEDGEDGEEEGGEELEGELGGGVLDEKGFDAVGAVVVFAVEDWMGCLDGVFGGWSI